MESITIILVIAIIVFAVLLLGTLATFVIYSGLVYPIEIGTGKPPIKGVTIAYKFNTGPYKEAGAVFSEVSGIAPDNLCVGLYYDDPCKVAAEKLRYAVGVVVSTGEKDKPILKALEDRKYKLFQLPEVSHAVTTKFPYRTQISILMAVWRVYPELSVYIKDKRLCAYPKMEVYTKEWIHFMAPLAKQEQFIVPEAQPKDEENTDKDESTVDESLNDTGVSETSTETSSQAGRSFGEHSVKDSTPSETSYDKRGGSTSEPTIQRKGVTPKDAGASAVEEEFVILDPIKDKKQK